jgi:hypothetical protein
VVDCKWLRSKILYDVITHLDLNKVSGGDTALEGCQKGGVLPRFLLGELLLHHLLDGDHAGSSAVLQLLNGFDDS